MDQDEDSMEVDDPNEIYKKAFGAFSSTALDDDGTLDVVLWSLARKVPDPPGQIGSPDDIAGLQKNDLRDLLLSGRLDEAAREIIKRYLTEKNKQAPAVDRSDGGRAAILDAFDATYIGDSSTVQIAIRQVISDTQVYANAIPFVQSSGTGKSRLMVELGQHFFVLMLNLRDDDAEGSYSHPQPDSAVRAYLQVMSTSPDAITLEKRWRLRYAAFLCAIFEVLYTVIAKDALTPQAFAERLLTSRGELLDEIIMRSKAMEEGFLAQYACAIPTSACSQITSDPLRHRAQQFFEKMQQHRPPSQPDFPPPLVLALDEAHVMVQRGVSVPASLLDILCSVLADLKAIYPGWEDNTHFACIFLSTNSSLSSIAPTVGQIASERLGSTSLAGALTCVPFDVFIEQNRKWTVAEISSLDFLALFGRPLFGALIKSGLSSERVLSLAKEKLAHAKQPFTAGVLMTNQTAFALLARRIMLHFRPLQSSSSTMASNLVAHHLQVAYVIPTHRAFLVSGSPSEPFLVEAAARIMATDGFNMIDCLLRFTNEELLDPGESGEIIGRSLMIDAYDSALRARPADLYHSWVPVLDFLHLLFPDDVYERIIASRPFEQPQGATLKTAFKNAVIRLTHFVRLSELQLVTKTNVRKAFLRGMGIVGAQSQKLIDILIPILFVDRSKAPSTWVVKEEEMSQIMANWKNKAADATPPHRDPYKDYPDLNTEKPTILMWHQFASRKNTVDIPQATKKHHPGGAVYFIDVYGITSDVYRSVTNENAAKYQQIVGCADIFRNAPYTYAEYVADMEKMLPRWSTTSFEQTAS